MGDREFTCPRCGCHRFSMHQGALTCRGDCDYQVSEGEAWKVCGFESALECAQQWGWGASHAVLEELDGHEKAATCGAYLGTVDGTRHTCKRAPHDGGDHNSVGEPGPSPPSGECEYPAEAVRMAYARGKADERERWLRSIEDSVQSHEQEPSADSAAIIAALVALEDMADVE